MLNLTNMTVQKEFSYIAGCKYHYISKNGKVPTRIFMNKSYLKTLNLLCQSTIEHVLFSDNLEAQGSYIFGLLICLDESLKGSDIYLQGDAPKLMDCC